MNEAVPSIAGTSILHFKEAVGSLYGPEVVRAGLARLDAEARSQIEQATPLVWVPAETLGRAVDAWSAAAGVSGEELTEKGVRIAVRTSFSTVWRVLLRITTDSALLARTPMIYAKTRNVGTLAAEFRGERTGRLVLTGWRGVTERQLLSLAIAFETILELTGRSHAKCRFRRTSDGGIFDITWGEAPRA